MDHQGSDYSLQMDDCYPSEHIGDVCKLGFGRGQVKPTAGLSIHHCLMFSFLFISHNKKSTFFNSISSNSIDCVVSVRRLLCYVMLCYGMLLRSFEFRSPILLALLRPIALTLVDVCIDLRKLLFTERIVAEL
jgi:hypothetical protein